jgi:hypothetical protein
MSILNVHKIKTSNGWYGLLLMQRIFLRNHPSIQWQDQWSKGEVVKGMVCYMYGTGRGVTIHNLLTSCELANILLNRGMTLIGTLSISLKFHHYFSVENKDRSILLYLVLPMT